MLHRTTMYVILFCCCSLLFVGCQAGGAASPQRSNKPPQHKSEAELAKKKEKPSARALGPKVEARGIYVTGWTAGTQRMNDLIDLIERTDLNAIVIDVKDDSGYLSYATSIPYMQQIGADRRPSIADLPGLLQRLRDKHIYTIGRISTFKDPVLARQQPDWALQRKDGGLWHDSKGILWSNPYDVQVWKYNIAIAKEAALLGFDEIQFDYVRFPDNTPRMNEEIAFHNPQRLSKSEAITNFLQLARDELHQVGAYVSADVFGLVTSQNTDMGIGQKWELISPVVDVISPMLYPSHYSRGAYGIDNPDASPAEVVRHAMMDAKEKNTIRLRNPVVMSTNTSINKSRPSATAESAADIRPWLQSFTATWLPDHRHYGFDEVQLQIQALSEQGIHQFLLWNAGSWYNYK